VMMRYGYNIRYITGVLAASGTITQLVPPSLVLIVLADQLGKSVGDMYLGAWGPSILQIALFAGYTFFLGLIKPDHVPAVPIDALYEPGAAETSLDVRARVVAARARQTARYAGTGIITNAQLTTAMMARHAAIDRAALSVVAAAMRKLSLSARGYDRVRKVARTIADLAGEDCIRAEHVAEALQFRRLS